MSVLRRLYVLGIPGVVHVLIGSTWYTRSIFVIWDAELVIGLTRELGARSSSSRPLVYTVRGHVIDLVFRPRIRPRWMVEPRISPKAPCKDRRRLLTQE